MKIEDRLRRELNDTAEHLALDKDTYEHVLDLGRRRRRSRQLGAAAGAAMIATVVVGVLALRPPVTPGPIVATTTTTAPPGTTTTSAPAGNLIPATTGVLLATPNDGIVISGFDGSSGSLTSDTYYEGIAWVISDGAGGIIFQHEVTPLPWTQGAILQLPAVATIPSVLVSPDPGTYVRPLDTDSGLLLYRVDSGGTSEVRTIDLRTQAIQTVIPATEFLINAGAEDGAVVAAYGGDCPRLEVFGLDGIDRQNNLDAGGCQVGFINDLAFSGGYVYTIEDTESRNLVRRDLETGETVVAPIGDAWSVAALPDGTVAAGGADIVIGTFQADVFTETARVPASTSFTLAAIDGFPGATLGTGTGELPCTPLDLPPLSPPGSAPGSGRQAHAYFRDGRLLRSPRIGRDCRGRRHQLQLRRRHRPPSIMDSKRPQRLRRHGLDCAYFQFLPGHRRLRNICLAGGPRHRLGYGLGRALRDPHLGGVRAVQPVP